MINSKYTHRQVVRIIVEATTPIAVGSGNKDVLTDSTVQVDVNGLPYIPGTSIAGVVRHAICKGEDKIFGWQGPSASDGHGSDVIFSEARMLGKDGEILDGIQDIDWSDDYYAHYRNLPIRQHVRISPKGTPEDRGKFDGQVVFKGTRFGFEIEFMSTADDVHNLDPVIDKLYDTSLRFGSGTRKGFGELKVVKINRTIYNLADATNLKAYLGATSMLSANFTDNVKPTETKSAMTEYRLTLRPNDFFLFASGYGDDDADITPVKEAYLDWSSAKPRWIERATLIPATSLKGALAHRTAYHWNKLNGRISGTKDAPLYNGENPAVAALFGLANDDGAKRGNVVFSDIITRDNSFEKVIPHVMINRFTCGTIDSALFDEKTVYANGSTYTTSIFVSKDVTDNTAIKAFETALNDLCEGLLPLGGGNNRGNGLFTGSFEKID